MLSFFYFFKKKTAYELRISDWSSDVCSSDLAPAAPDIDDDEEEQPHVVDEVPVPGGGFETEMLLRAEMTLIGAHAADDQEADRKSVGEGKRGSVRVDLGGRRTTKKNSRVLVN